MNATHISSLPHQLGGVDFRPRGNDLALTDPLLRRGRRERLLQLDREIDVFEQNGLDRHTPLFRRGFDNLGNLLGETFAVGNDGLQDAASDDLTEGSFCREPCQFMSLTGALDKSQTDIIDTECGAVRRDDYLARSQHRPTMPADHRIHFDRHIVLGLHVLPRHWRQLNLDVCL